MTEIASVQTKIDCLKMKLKAILEEIPDLIKLAWVLIIRSGEDEEIVIVTSAEEDDTKTKSSVEIFDFPAVVQSKLGHKTSGTIIRYDSLKHTCPENCQHVETENAYKLIRMAFYICTGGTLFRCKPIIWLGFFLSVSALIRSIIGKNKRRAIQALLGCAIQLIIPYAIDFSPMNLDMFFMGTDE